MHKQAVFFSLLFTIFFANYSKADSPLTSTQFYQNYENLDMVVNAQYLGIMNEEIANYLMDENVLIDYKAAVINALGWSYDGKQNAVLFKDYLSKKHGWTSVKIKLELLTADELFCLGYLTALDNYNDVTEAIGIINEARNANRESLTVNLIWSLVNAQAAFDSDWCGIWRSTRDVLNDSKLKRDIKVSAIQNIVDYTILYKSYCNTEGIKEY